VIKASTKLETKRYTFTRTKSGIKR